MEEITRCSRCIVPASLPSVTLDQDGVCNFCRRFEELDGRMNASYFDDKKAEFEAMVRRVKQLNKVYDCLIPLSGGKDSTYALYLCAKEYGLKCVCVTLDNGYLSDHARQNIARATRAAGADHFYFSPNQNKMIDMYGEFMRKSGTFCPVCMRGIQACVQMIFDQFKPPLVITGTGRRVTYLGHVPEVFQGGDLSFYKNVVKDEPYCHDLKSLHYAPTSRQINKLKELACRLLGLHPRLLGFYSYYIALYDYFQADFAEIRAILESEMDWTSPEGQFEHMDCLLHGIPSYIHTLRFPELTESTLYDSNLIRLGLLTREEALENERRNRTTRREPQILDSFLQQTGTSKEEFTASVSDWKRTDGFRNKFDEGLRRRYNRMLGKR
jgi:hypothetical protein